MESQLKISPNLSLLTDEDLLVVFKGKSFETIKLEPQLSSLLMCFIRSEHAVLSKDYIIESVWPDNIYVGRNALRKNVYKLRALFKEYHIEHLIEIITIPKKGYKLNAVEEETRPYFKTKYMKAVAIAAASLIICFIVMRGVTEEDIDYRIPSSELVQLP